MSLQSYSVRCASLFCLPLVVRSTCIAACSCCTFACLCVSPLHEWASLFIQSPVDGHWSLSLLGLSWMVLLWTLLFRSSDALLCTFFCWLVVFSCPVISESVQPRGHTRLPCPSPSPRACSNSWPLNQCCHPTISSSAVLFSSCLRSFPASGSFQMSQLFASGGQSIGASASASVLPMNIQDWITTEQPRNSLHYGFDSLFANNIEHLFMFIDSIFSLENVYSDPLFLF